ncbi:MAG: pilin [Patescibacteria group bacterium]
MQYPFPFRAKSVIKITASCFLFLLAVFLFSNLFIAVPAYAAGEEITAGLDAVGSQTPLVKSDPRQIVGRIIKIALGFLGAVAISIIIYAGFLYMTSGGDPAKTEIARKWIINAVIGLAIIFSAYAITTYIFNQLLKAINNDSTPSSGFQISSLAGTGYGLSNGAFGTVIQNHYPLPEQTAVPRNTMILVTFKIPVDVVSIIDTNDKALCPQSLEKGKICGALKKDAFRIYKCSDMMLEEYGEQNKIDCFNSKVIDIKDETKLVPGYALLTEDQKTIMFNPYGDTNDHLGSATADVPYIVYLTPKIKQKENPAITVFSKTYPDYKWRFTTSTVLDLTPPKILAVVPTKQVYPVKNPSGCNKCPGGGCSDYDCEGKVYLNQTIAVHFNEPVIPPLTQTQNCTEGDNDNEAQVLSTGLASSICKTNHLPGAWKVGLNQYKTIQFVSSTECAGGAINSCGEKVFCLPSDAEITSKVLAAQILTVGMSQIGTGIMDMGGNSLDGNANGKSEGPGELTALPSEQEKLKDNYFWDFKTGTALDLVPPILIGLDPNNKTQNIKELQLPLKATFNKDLDGETVDNEVGFKGTNSASNDFTGWFDSNFGEENSVIKMKEIVIQHAPFEEWQEASDSSPIYAPIINSDLKDSRQNCFSPTKNEAGKITESTCAEDVKVPGSSCCPENNLYNLVGKPNLEECVVPE